jgi:hypothetical protein
MTSINPYATTVKQRTVHPLESHVADIAATTRYVDAREHITGFTGTTRSLSDGRSLALQNAVRRFLAYLEENPVQTLRVDENTVLRRILY